jgi:N-acetylglucosamine kinase-like BadF-type ATPase
VDIGGTSTRIVGGCGTARFLDRVIPTASWRIRETAADAAALVHLVRDAADQSDPAVLVIGAHGCDSDLERLRFQQAVAAETRAVVLVLNDAELLLPASGVEQGIALIAGTGSIAVARQADASMLTAGGWGWFLGDEGSASGLVREAARAVRGAIDAGERPDILAALLSEALGLADITGIGKALVARGSAVAIGSLVPLVFDAERRGSRIAAAVIEEGGAALAALVLRLIGRGATGNSVVLGGGVLTAQPSLMDAFRRALAASAPSWTARLVPAAPVEGALSLARRILARDVPANLPPPCAAGEGWR